MDIERFRAIVARLEKQSVEQPRAYKTKVALLAVLGFAILALLMGTVGLGLLLLVGLVVLVALQGGAALLVLAKFGKLLVLLAVPLWYLLKASMQALFIRLPPPEGREIRRTEAPALFEAIDTMRARMQGPRFHHVLVVDEVNAAIVQRPAFGIVGPARNYLLLGLPLLESMPPQEALAVVAHEYGHLAGSHARFGAYIYRLRHTWGTVQAFAEQVQGWLGRMVVPLVRWYVPHFNAWSFVLARTNEYQADAASAELVGAAHAAHALKRVNVVAPRHQRFLQQTFERIDHEPAPPHDLQHRWAAQAATAPAETDAARWLADALDREGDPLDTHPTLRARLAALPQQGGEALEAPPPPLEGVSAAQAWLGPLVGTLRAEFDAQWLQRVATPWSERHAEAQQWRQRLAELRAQPAPDAATQIEILRLAWRFEPATELIPALAAFNAAHPGHALGLFTEGAVRLEQGERAGLAMLDQAMALDPEATRAACERAHAFLVQHKDQTAAETYAERWRQRAAFEAARSAEIDNLDSKADLQPHGLDAEVLATVRARLDEPARKGIAEVYLVRRVLRTDPGVLQLVLGVRLTWWGRRRGRQRQTVDRLAAMEWPVPLLFITLDGAYQPLRKKMRKVAGARLV